MGFEVLKDKISKDKRLRGKTQDLLVDSMHYARYSLQNGIHLHKGQLVLAKNSTFIP